MAEPLYVRRRLPLSCRNGAAACSLLAAQLLLGQDHFKVTDPDDLLRSRH